VFSSACRRDLRIGCCASAGACAVEEIVTAILRLQQLAMRTGVCAACPGSLLIKFA
jgi:hypothetical protein